LNKNRAI